MTTTLAVFSTDALRYVLPHVSKEESRPILNGAYFEPSGIACATSGHTLCMYKGAVTGLTRPIILRIEKPASVTARKVDHITAEIPDAPDYSAHILLTLRSAYGQVLAVAVAYEVEGPFPNFRQVLPTGDPSDLARIALDPAKLNRFSVADQQAITLDFYGEHKAVGVRYPNNACAYGLIMPIRTMDQTTPSATWPWQSETWGPAPTPADHAERYAVAVTA